MLKRKRSPPSTPSKQPKLSAKQLTPSKPSQSAYSSDQFDKEFGEIPIDEYASEFEDTTVGLKLLRQIVLKSCQKFPPIVLRHMLYALLQDLTATDRTLDELLRNGTIRQFKLPTLGKDEIAYLFTEDYVDYIKKILPDYKETIQKSINKKYKVNLQSPKKRSIEYEDIDLDALIDKYIKELIPKCSDLCIAKSELQELLQCKDGAITHLMKMGLLTFKDEHYFWFSIPNCGAFINFVLNGRRELVSILKRKKYKEMLLHLLAEKKLNNTALPIGFHIRDIIGCGLAYCLDTANGKLVCLKNKG